MSFNFNEQQNELLNEYRKILTYGYRKISQIELNFSKVRARKTVLYFMMGAMQSYSESILKLMGSEPAFEKPGESLLRSQVEIWMNIRFIYSSRSEKNARLFLSDILMDSIDFAKKHQKLWQDNLSWNLEFGKIKNPIDWDNFIDEQRGILTKYRRKYKDKNVGKLPSFKDRVIAVDKYLKKKNKLTENNSAEKYYTLFYKYFSQSTHLTMNGLSRFMRDQSGQSFLDIDSTPDDAERVLSVSYQLYFTTLHFFLNVFGCYSSSEFKNFKTYSAVLLKGKNRSK